MKTWLSSSTIPSSDVEPGAVTQRRWEEISGNKLSLLCRPWAWMEALISRERSQGGPHARTRACARKWYASRGYRGIRGWQLLPVPVSRNRSDLDRGIRPRSGAFPRHRAMRRVIGGALIGPAEPIKSPRERAHGKAATCKACGDADAKGPRNNFPLTMLNDALTFTLDYERVISRRRRRLNIRARNSPIRAQRRSLRSSFPRGMHRCIRRPARYARACTSTRAVHALDARGRACW